MKKKLAFRVIIDILLIFSLSIFIFHAVQFFKSSNGLWALYNQDGLSQWKEGAIENFFTAIISLFCAIISIVFFIVFNFKDIQWLCGSLAKEIKEHKEATAEERKQKKIEDLQKQLDELKKE